jgi:hypothetical protein
MVKLVSVLFGEAADGCEEIGFRHLGCMSLG